MTHRLMKSVPDIDMDWGDTGGLQGHASIRDMEVHPQRPKGGT